jgi:hypothetical protein
MLFRLNRDFISARGYSLKKLSIHWLCSAVGCLYEQISAEFVFDFLGRSCPMLTELDVSGLKNISAVSLQQLLDTKLAQVKPHKISDLLNSFFLLALVCGRLQDFYLTFMLVSRLIVELISIQLSHDSRKYTQMTGNL